MMTVAQAKRLFSLVRAARAYNYEVPSGRQLAELLYPGKTVGWAQIRAANAVVQRLGKYGCIRKKGTVRRIDEARLVTERSSAQFVLLFRDLCLAAPDLTITRETLEAQARSHLPEDVDLEVLFARAVEGRYITPIAAQPGHLRIGGHLNDQLPYLSLFLEDATQ